MLMRLFIVTRILDFISFLINYLILIYYRCTTHGFSKRRVKESLRIFITKITLCILLFLKYIRLYLHVPIRKLVTRSMYNIPSLRSHRKAIRARYYLCFGMVILLIQFVYVKWIKIIFTSTANSYHSRNRS